MKYDAALKSADTRRKQSSEHAICHIGRQRRTFAEELFSETFAFFGHIQNAAAQLTVSARALSGVMKTFSTWPQFASPPLSHSLTSSRPAAVRGSHLENVPAIVLQNGALSAGIAPSVAVERKG